MLNRHGQQPDPGLLMEEVDEDYTYGGLRGDEARDALARRSGIIGRPVETVETPLSDPGFKLHPAAPPTDDERATEIMAWLAENTE